MKLITIITHANGHLVAEQRPQSAGFLMVLLALILLVVSIQFIRARAWKWLLIPGLAFLFMMLLSFTGTTTTYRISVDQPRHLIVSEQIVRGKIVATTTTPASDLSSAELQFDRGARTIVLVHRDGHQSFPLGEQELQDEPGQYVILNALREAIGQNPVPPREGRRTAAQTPGRPAMD
ncbi:hypothetical protein ABQJ54_17300 [Rhodanobacter sp. Si-c]|uniref:Uncharacterized protein n=1 Tax=Rhodanobacter lycopersici TaxID=3162487 RepID=A0ABV3QI47_9GAMM